LSDAVRAQALIDRWGGHPGTSEKKLRFNGNPWIDLPELTTTPAGHEPTAYMYQDNPIVHVPLGHLREGENTFEGTCGDQVAYSFRWGQWGWYGMVLRVFYPPTQPHPTGSIVSPRPGETLGENPTVAATASGDAPIARVDFLAHYEGYDENGDGVYLDWHHNYHNTHIGQHVGTATAPPYRVVWDTRWVPDQPPGSVKLLARIQDETGMWHVTQPVENLSLVHDGSSPKLYRPSGVPERFWVRAGGKRSCNVNIPIGDDLAKATEAAIHLRTWNGHNHGTGTITRVNDWSANIPGAGHNYAYAVHPVPVTVLRDGANVIEFASDTEHHGVEILWPGPALTVRYSTER
ncbi:MAG: Ig-like domain-containing protein, partial [Armatimonadota bacterium]